MNHLLKKCLPALTLLFAAATLAGCLDRKEALTLNPDGSGKITFETVFAPPPRPIGNVAPPPLTEKQLTARARQSAETLVLKTRGVDAWKDVTYEVTKDGADMVKGTAYFQDINGLNTGFGFPVKWEKLADGQYRLSYQINAAAPADSNPPKLTDAEVTARVEKERAAFKKSLPDSRRLFALLKVDSLYTLPGSIKDTNILNKKSGNSVALTIEGTKMLDAMEKAMADDKKLEQQIRSGKTASNDPEVMTETIFGKKGAISATVTGATKPLFDYPSEMSAAKSSQAAMFKKIEIDSTRNTDVPPMTMDAPGQP